MNSQDLAKLSADNEIPKKHKKRTKKIKSHIQEQVEFYFGDANLQKDRFMKQEISKHPEGYVAISTIASFNKMKQITDDLDLVVKGMKMSSMLEVSEDDKMVRRKTPIPEPRNVDAETIYIEKLPPYADHDWVKAIFSKYGKVVYVSIPRFKHTGDIKGFAFVEFEYAKEAKEAVQMFNKGGKYKQDNEPEEKVDNSLSMDQLSELHKIAKGRRKRSHSESELDTQQKQKERKRKRTISESSADSADNEQHVDVKQEHRALKRKGGDDSKDGHEALDGETECKEKRSKKSVQWVENKQAADEEKIEITALVGHKRSHDDSAGDEEGTEQKRQRLSDTSDSRAKDSAEENGEGESGEGSKKHKKRKRKRKEKKETRLPHLRVMSKLEWLELKKEYKNLQREAMNNLKKQLQTKSTSNINQEENQENGQSQVVDAAASKGKSTNQITIEAQEQRVGVKKLPYEPGVVLKFYRQNLDTTKTDLRTIFSSYVPVAYLDITEGSSEGHVRFHTAENCVSVFKAMSSTSDQVKLEKLTEEAEKSYWEKINADRMARYDSKREKKRGTEKVARKAEALQVQRQSHIRFDDSDGEGET